MLNKRYQVLLSEWMEDYINLVAEKYDLNRLNKSRERYKGYKRDDFNLKTMQPGEFLSSEI